MHRLFGLETEYGIQISGIAHPDVVVESMELVRCFLHRDFRPLWDYGLEDPHQDARGFAVDELLNDSDETTHLQKDRERQIPLQELKSDLILPAPISPELVSQVQDIARRAFQAVDCAGMARVDFFLERGTDRLYLNELNTIPGFTDLSMYSMMWEVSGLSYPRLLDRLIELALERFADKERNRV